MTSKAFIERIEDLLEMEHGSLHEDDLLVNVEGWDSLVVMSFIAMVDETLGVVLKAPTIAAAKTIADLVALVADRLEANNHD
jgi:acyl carrier protein